MMKKTARRIDLGARPPAAGRPALAQERAYLLGIISYGNSAQMIASEYHGLTTYLSRVLKKPVRVEGARDFTTFAERARRSAITSCSSRRRPSS